MLGDIEAVDLTIEDGSKIIEIVPIPLLKSTAVLELLVVVFDGWTER